MFVCTRDGIICLQQKRLKLLLRFCYLKAAARFHLKCNIDLARQLRNMSTFQIEYQGVHFGRSQQTFRFLLK